MEIQHRGWKAKRDAAKKRDDLHVKRQDVRAERHILSLGDGNVVVPDEPIADLTPVETNHTAPEELVKAQPDVDLKKTTKTKKNGPAPLVLEDGAIVED